MGAGVIKKAGSGRRRRGRGARHQAMAEINVTPMVDVMLVLLIIFMVAAPMMTVGVPLELPKTAAKAVPTEQEEPLTISLQLDGTVSMMNAPVPMEELIGRLQAVAQERDSDKVFLRADGGSADVKPAPAPAAVVAAAPAAAAAAPAAAAPGDEKISWMWPSEGKVIGTFDEGKNKGVDIAGKAGQQVVAAGAGKVMYAGSGIRGYGNLVIVKHSNSLLSAYAHNRSILVKEGQNVNKGQAIAEMGDSDADRVKLHFEIRQQGKPVDPSKFLPNR